jgi:LemA protein
MLGGALRQLFALAKAYPDLKANSNFQQLQSDLTGIENKLAAARRSFTNSSTSARSAKHSTSHRK